MVLIMRGPRAYPASNKSPSRRVLWIRSRAYRLWRRSERELGSLGRTLRTSIFRWLLASTGVCADEVLSVAIVNDTSTLSVAPLATPQHRGYYHFCLMSMWLIP